MLFLETYFFKISKDLISLAFFFFAETDTKKKDMPRQKPPMLH